MSLPTVQVYSGSNAIELKNSLIVRPFTITGSWNTIRVGMLCCFGSGSNADIGTGVLSFGLSSGTTNVFGDPVCTHFVGFMFTGSTFTYISQSTNMARYYQNLTGYFGRRASGSFGISNYTSVDVISGFYMYLDDPATGKGKSPCYLEIAKTTPTTYGCKLWYVSNPNNTTYGYTSVDSFVREMLSTSPSPDNSSLGVTSQVSVPVSESISGSLNAVNISWDREDPNPVLAVYAIAVAVLA